MEQPVGRLQSLLDYPCDPCHPWFSPCSSFLPGQ